MAVTDPLGDYCYCLLPTAYCISARVAQLIERWSYKPEVEGLSPSLGTKRQGKRQKVEVKSNDLNTTMLFAFYLFTFDLVLSGRDSSRQNGDCKGAWSSKRRGRLHAPTTRSKGDVAPNGRAAVP